MAGRGAAPESLLEELSLAEEGPGEISQAQTDGSGIYRLKRAHLPIPIESIVDASPHQSRLITFDPERYPKDAELLESVKKHGVLEPIYLERVCGGLGEASRYCPIAGHRRLAAARLAGHKTIDSIIAKEDDDVEAFALAENLGHRELTAYEKALSLMALKGSDPSLSLRDLARRSGLAFGTVSGLVGAYEKSTPVLRRRFAEGMAPRAIQELQPIFEGIPEATQMELAAILGEASQLQAAACRQMVERGVDPVAAAKSAMALAGGEGKPAEDLSQGAGTAPSGNAGGEVRKRKSKSRQAEKDAWGIPDAQDDDSLLALSARTGVSKSTARRLAKAARRIGSDYTSLSMACAHAAAGGEVERSLEVAHRVAANRRIASLFRRHLDNLERVRGLIAVEEDPEAAGFLQTIFFGAQD